jgi:hypothetical protein
MIAGIASGLLVLLLVEAFTLVVRKEVERWGDGVDLDQVSYLAGRPISRTTHPVEAENRRGDDVATNSSSTVTSEDYLQTLKNLTRSS